MLTLRCTKKLLTRLRVKPDLQPPPSSTKLGDWYADVLNMGRERLVLCVSERTLLPVVVPASGAELRTKLVDGLRQTLMALGAPTAVIDAELNHMQDVTLSKTASRAVLGSMNEFQFMARHFRVRDPRGSLLAMGLDLADVLCGTIDYAPPMEATLDALGTAPRPSKPKLGIAPPPPPSPRRPRWALGPTPPKLQLSPFEKERLLRLVSQFVDEHFRRHLRAPPKGHPYNYVSDYYVKWHGPYLTVGARYTCPGGSEAEGFDAPLARLGYFPSETFSLWARRHTDEWIALEQGLSLDECFHALKTNPWFER